MSFEQRSDFFDLIIIGQLFVATIFEKSECFICFLIGLIWSVRLYLEIGVKIGECDPTTVLRIKFGSVKFITYTLSSSGRILSLNAPLSIYRVTRQVSDQYLFINSLIKLLMINLFVAQSKIFIILSIKNNHLRISLILCCFFSTWICVSIK